MQEDRALIALMDESIPSIDAVALLPDDFWDEYCYKPTYAHGEYINLSWTERQAISLYFDMNDLSLAHAIWANAKFIPSDEFRRFYMDKAGGKVKRADRKKATTKWRDLHIYNIITAADAREKNKTPAINALANEYCKGIEAIKKAEKRGKKVSKDLDNAMKADILQQYKIYLSRYK
jgi:hypothetical protein